MAMVGSKSRSIGSDCDFMNASHSGRVKTPGVVPRARTHCPNALAMRRHSSGGISWSRPKM